MWAEPPGPAAADPPSGAPASGPRGQMDGGLGLARLVGCKRLLAPQRREKKSNKKNAPVKFLCVVSCNKKIDPAITSIFQRKSAGKQAATGMVRTPVMSSKSPAPLPPPPRLEFSSFYNHWCAHTHTPVLFICSFMLTFFQTRQTVITRNSPHGRPQPPVFFSPSTRGRGRSRSR